MLHSMDLLIRRRPKFPFTPASAPADLKRRGRGGGRGRGRGRGRGGECCEGRQDTVEPLVEGRLVVHITIHTRVNAARAQGLETKVEGLSTSAEFLVIGIPERQDRVF